MVSTRFTRRRSELGRAVRDLPPEHPRIVALREELKSALVVQRIALALAKANVPITPELRAEIDEVLASHQVVTTA